ncbi:hypothetical protein J4N45_02890 [Vibrio sp. SCSIO 43140]|uniref:hypothetical protein n=1 Tax=Vibrio sp. SCSIO 43140 TaxID=2819100 RepID=UPI00207650D0|nr:hypothetical protein [Vibrio sp. SCSIO 43140]USD60958.1 hypothetical protein J4N45_02890 [Vibrio sp. SCSIO 43140]
MVVNAIKFLTPILFFASFHSFGNDVGEWFYENDHLNITPSFRIGKCKQIKGEADLNRCFGHENVFSTYEFTRDGEELPATILYPNVEGKTLRIFWFDDQRTEPRSVKLTADGSQWRVGTELYVGLSSQELAKVNKANFAVRDFDFDEQGEVLWNSGFVMSVFAPERLRVYLDIQNDLSSEQMMAVSGQGVFCFSQAEKLGVKMAIKEINLYFSDQQHFEVDCKDVEK